MSVGATFTALAEPEPDFLNLISTLLLTTPFKFKQSILKVAWADDSVHCSFIVTNKRISDYKKAKNEKKKKDIPCCN